MAGEQFKRPPIHRVQLVTNDALNVSGRKGYSKELSMGGEGWYNLRLRISLVVVIGTGSGAIAEGELRIVRKIFFKTDRGEIICNLPGRALYKMNAYRHGVPPQKDAIAAASATYRVELVLPFADMTMARPEDTILDTRRYESCELEIEMGGVADLFTTPGTSTVTATVDVEVERSKGKLTDVGGPFFYPSYDYRPPVDASTTTAIDLLKSDDLSYKRLMVHASASGTAGMPFSGTNADDVQDVVTLEDSDSIIERGRIHSRIQNLNKNDAGLETVLAGIEVFDFVRDGSIGAALAAADHSLIQYKWTNQAGVAANDIVTLAFEGIRSLRPKG